MMVYLVTACCIIMVLLALAYSQWYKSRDLYGSVELEQGVSKKVDPFIVLNLEIVDLIMEYLNPIELCVVSRSNSCWNRYIKERTLIWVKLVHKLYTEDVNRCSLLGQYRVWCIEKSRIQLIHEKNEHEKLLLNKRKRVLETLLFGTSLALQVGFIPGSMALFHWYNISPVVVQLFLGGTTGVYAAQYRWVEFVYSSPRLRTILVGALIALTANLSYTVVNAFNVLSDIEHSLEISDANHVDSLLVIYLIHFLRINGLIFFVFGFYINVVYRRVPEPWWFLFINGFWILILGETSLYVNQIKSLPHEAFFWEVLYTISIVNSVRSIFMIAYRRSWAPQFAFFNLVEHYQRDLVFSILCVIISKGVISYYELYSAFWVWELVLQVFIRYICPYTVICGILYKLKQVSIHPESNVSVQNTIKKGILCAPIILEVLCAILEAPNMVTITHYVLDILSLRRTLFYRACIMYYLLRTFNSSRFTEHSFSVDIAYIFACINESLIYSIWPYSFMSNTIMLLLCFILVKAFVSLHLRIQPRNEQTFGVLDLTYVVIIYTFALNINPIVFNIDIKPSILEILVYVIVLLALMMVSRNHFTGNRWIHSLVSLWILHRVLLYTIEINTHSDPYLDVCLNRSNDLCPGQDQELVMYLKDSYASMRFQ